MILLRVTDHSDVSFLAPGAFHQARWMPKKSTVGSCSFQHQFTLTNKEKNYVKELGLFMSPVYVRFWHEAPLGRKAPLNDMQFLESLMNYPNRTIAKADRDTFSPHLWYFQRFLVGLSFLMTELGQM